jgi:calcium/calmodulin-dependent protein kinase I
LLTLDTKARLTATEALNHTWMTSNELQEVDLLETVRENFNPRRTLKSAVGAIRAMNRLKISMSDTTAKEGGNNPALSKILAAAKASKQQQEQTDPVVPAVAAV